MDGQRANLAMKRLSASAPVFAARAEELLRNGDFEGALEAADNAVDLDASVAEHHVVRGNALQVLMRLEEAKRAYGRALEMGKDERAVSGLKLTEEVIAKVAKDGEAEAENVLAMGYTSAQARAKFAEQGALRGLYEEQYTEEGLSAAEKTGAAIGYDPLAAQKLERRKQLRKASFLGGGRFAATTGATSGSAETGVGAAQ